MLNVKIAMITFGFLMIGSIIDGSVPKEVKMDNALRKKLNTFFSNFSEVGVEPFNKDKIDNKSLISFGVLHNYINRSDRWESADDLHGKLKAKYVEAAVEKYFGRKIEKHESVPPYIRYKNGYYYMPHADGEGTIIFSQITKLIEIGNGFFVATVDIYEASDHVDFNPHGTPVEWRKAAARAEKKYGVLEDVPKRIATMTATIRKVSKERYILLEYLKTDK